MIWKKKIQKYNIAVDIAKRIIRKKIINKIAFDTNDPKNQKEISNKLKSISIKFSWELVYSILQKLLYHIKITELKKYKKPLMEIFIGVKYLYNYS